MSAIEAHSERLAELIDPRADVEVLGEGFGFLEGPAWHPQQRSLLFSDLEHDVRRRWAADDGISVAAEGTNHANGMTYDIEGRLLVCEHATSRLIRIEGDGTRSVIASHFEGKELNSPNDVIVRSDGSIYFTDPEYGRMNDEHGIKRPTELDFAGIYGIAPGQTNGQPQLLASDFDKPNGLCFSVDESVLYVADTMRMHVRRFDVAGDGSLSGGEIFVVEGEEGQTQDGFPDGMRLDEHGNLFVCGPGGVWVVGMDGQHLGTIKTPEVAANLTWGGDDLRSLFICASSRLLMLRTKTRANAVPHLRALAR